MQNHALYDFSEIQVSSTQDHSNASVVLRIVVMLLYAIIVLYAGTVPYRHKNFVQNVFVKSISTTFAGAVFLNVGLLHILPEAHQQIQNILNPQHDKNVFPLAFFLMMFGFMLTILFTKFIAKHDHHHHQHHEFHHKIGRQNEMEPIQKFIQKQEQKQDENVDQTPSDQQKNNEAIAITIAMFIHTFFQGVTIGVQTDTLSLATTAFAISLHKWADAFSVGLVYKNNNLPIKKAYTLTVLQALLNILSMLLGWFINTRGPMIQAVFQAISAGTFLALSLTQMLNEQLNKKQYQLQKGIALVAATALVALIWVVDH